jgi:3D (Asp-Asp-Asp) domain-containing protein
MKTKTKTYKLGLILMLLCFTASSICMHSYNNTPHCNDVKGVKAQLQSVPAAQEKNMAKDIKIQNNGIMYKDDFIPKTNSFRVLTVRITVYWAKGGDTDSDSAKRRSSTGYTLKQGESIAVDPRIIPYTKEVIIPNVGLVKAVDTGTAVVQKRASGGKLPVIDVFFEHKKDAILFANRYPKIVKVAVLN